MDILTQPHVERRGATPTLGITVTTPFRGMLSVRDQLLAELIEWLEQSSVEDHGDFYLRLHTIDMNGPMRIEVGIRGVTHTGDDRVRSGTFPAGLYAAMTYRNHSLQANKLLLNWVADQGLTLDRRQVAEGDHFGCRYEAYRTDPRTQPRKTRWEVELQIRLSDGN